MDAQAFTKAKENLATSFSYQTYPDSVSVRRGFLTESQDQSVGLLRQTLLEPRFDMDAIERVRAQIIAGLKSDAKDPAESRAAAFNQRPLDFRTLMEAIKRAHQHRRGADPRSHRAGASKMRLCWIGSAFLAVGDIWSRRSGPAAGYAA